MNRNPSLQELLLITGALADASRVRLLLALRGGELCVCQLLGLLKLAPSTVSKHMSILHQAGLVAASKRGKWVYYALVGRGASPVARKAVAWLIAAAAATREIEADARRLKTVNRTSRDTLCQCYR
ncbi:MAG: metalloregulator ArsR/SmtB family transcription factor [bacterium]|nr:metalloregulator ArsR/SmtB family transcription factor [bacterium]